jgi:DNA-binding CsgD family transcriptional regulator
MRHHLGKREHECLLWIAKGKTYAEIGEIVGLAFGSVKTYLDAARYKLGACNLSRAVAIAVATGILKYEELDIPQDWDAEWSEANQDPSESCQSHARSHHLF